MARKTIVEPVLSPRDKALLTASTIVALEQQKADLESKIKEGKAALEAYYNETGEKELGALQVEIRNAKPKIDFGSMTPKEKKYCLEQLLRELPDYGTTTTDLDVEKLYFAMNTSAEVQNALKVRNLKIVQETSVAFKKVGNAA